MARFVPSLLFSPYAGGVAERFERRALMVVLDLASVVLMVALTVWVRASAATSRTR